MRLIIIDGPLVYLINLISVLKKCIKPFNWFMIHLLGIDERDATATIIIDPV